MKTIQRILIFVLLTVFIACNNNNTDTKPIKDNVNYTIDKHENEKNKEKTHWSYDGKESPEKWADLSPDYSACNGKIQSPINLSSDIDFGTDVKFSKNYNCLNNLEFINNGHTIQVNFTNERPNMLTVNQKDFELKQFHFHSPSEHSLDGNFFDGEIHFIHVSETGSISVLSTFIKEGKENDFLNVLIPDLPVKNGDKTIVTGKVCVNDIFSKTDKYYIYEGSLTTPPCTEGVNWFVRKGCIEASSEQIEALKKVMPNNNHRPIQDSNNREFGKLDKE